MLTLPPGSSYRGASGGDASWSAERHQLADVLDVLLVINWRLMGCPDEYKPSPIERPGDAERRRAARAKARKARKKIEDTQWGEA